LAKVAGLRFLTRSHYQRRSTTINMTSVDNILGLVSHLHSMESSFSAILIEAAMKLASLTDANLFILVETKDGRRFAGKRHLCNLYTSGELTPVGSDLEMEVDPSVIGLRARYVGSPGSQLAPTNPTSSSSSSSTSTTTVGSQSQTATSIRPSTPPTSSSSAGSTSTPKIGAKRASDAVGSDGERRKVFVVGQNEAQRKSSIKFEAVELQSNPGSTESPGRSSRSETARSDLIDAKSLHANSVPPSHPQHQSRAGDELPALTNSGSQTGMEYCVDSSYIEPFAGHFLESEDEFKTMLQNQSGSQFEGSALQLPLSCGMEGSSGSDVHDTSDEEHLLAQQHQQQSPNDHLPPGHRQQMEFGTEKEDRKPYDHVMGWNTTDFLSKSVRANNILSISDSSLVDKSSANHRMFMSLIHEYTKESVKYVPEEKLARKEFVDKIFFNFWLYFPHLDTLHNLGAKISIGKRYYFLKAFVRAGIARGLSSILGRRSGCSQESLENIEKKLTEMRRN